MIAGIEI